MEMYLKEMLQLLRNALPLGGHLQAVRMPGTHGMLVPCRYGSLQGLEEDRIPQERNLGGRRKAL